MLALGVRVAVQVMPPSPVVRVERLPFGAVTSAVVKPVTASAKVKVTVAVSPIFSAVSEIVIAEARVGRTPSTTRALLAARELAAPGVARVRTALLPAASLIAPLLRARAEVET